VKGRVIVLTALVLAGAAADAVPRLVLDGWDDPRLVGALSNRAELVKRFDLMYVVVAKEGQTLTVVDVPGYSRASFAGDSGILPEIGRRCRSVGMKWYAMCDMLTRSPSQPGDSPMPLEMPLVTGRHVIGRREASYVSPFAASTRSALTSLVAGWSRWAEAPSGLALGLHLARSNILGYSEAARGAYIRDVGRDPIDLRWPDEIAAWSLWRERKLTEVMQELVGTYRAKHPNTPVSVLGTGDLPIRSAEARCASADNWLGWLESGLADDVILDASWEPPATGRIWDTLRQLSATRLQASGKSFLGTSDGPLSRLRPLVRTVQRPPVLEPFNSKPVPPTPPLTIEAQISTLREAGAPIENAVYYPQSIEELDQVLKLLDKQAGSTKPGGAEFKR
jgi:hypothetical protein